MCAGITWEQGTDGQAGGDGTVFLSGMCWWISSIFFFFRIEMAEKLGYGELLEERVGVGFPQTGVWSFF